MTLEPIKILIVEDDEQQSSSLSRLLQIKLADTMSVNLQIEVVATLKEALEHAPSASVTLLDLNLRDAGTTEVIAAIRLFRPPVIVMTGNPDEALHAQCKMNGADYVFIKGATKGLCRAILHAMTKYVLMSTPLSDDDGTQENP